MKENECSLTLQNSLKWLVGAFAFWGFLLVYLCLWLAPVFFAFEPCIPPLPLVSRFYVLFAILTSVKYLTFTNFPEVSSGRDELRKLFTSITPFHLHIVISCILYPMLFKELRMLIGYSKVSSWGNFYGLSLGLVVALAYLLRHEYITYWFNPSYSRLMWLGVKFPGVVITSISVNVALTIGLNLMWALWKYEIPGTEYWSYGTVVYTIENLLSRVLQNFLAKPIRLDDKNNLGEELAISGLTQKEPETHFQCFQDLLRASASRKLQIMDPKIPQWNLLLETGLNYLSKVPRHIQNYSTLKNKYQVFHSNRNSQQIQSFIISGANQLYFIFNEPFEVKFRHELFKMFTMAVLASNVLCKYVTARGSHNFVLQDSSLSMILQMQAETIAEVDKYLMIDPEISVKEFRESIVNNIIEIKEVYSDYLPSIALRGDTLQLLGKLR